MNDRIKKREGAILDFNTPPKSNYVDEVLVHHSKGEFSRIFNEAAPLDHVQKTMGDLYVKLIAAFEQIPDEIADSLLEKIQRIPIVDFKIIHGELKIELTKDVKGLFPVETHEPMLAVIKKGMQLSFDAIYTADGRYQPDFAEFMDKSFKQAHPLAKMEKYCEKKGFLLEANLISGAGLYVFTMPTTSPIKSPRSVLGLIFSNCVLKKSFDKYAAARFDIIDKKAEKVALKKVCKDLEAHFRAQKNLPDLDEKLKVLKKLKESLEIKGVLGIKAFASYYQKPGTLNTLKNGSDTLTKKILKAVGEMLASILSLGAYAVVRAHQSKKRFGTSQFWLTPDEVLEKSFKKHSKDVKIYNAPPAKKPKR